MSRLITTLLVTSLFAVPACKKKDGAAGSGSAAAEKTTSGGGGGATGCPAGAYSNPEGGFCFQMPAGAKFDSKTAHDDGGGEFSFVAVSDGAPLFNVVTYPKTAYEDHLAGVKEDAKGLSGQKALQSGDLPGGGYYYVVSYQSNGATQNKILCVAKHATGVIEFEGLTDDKGLQATLDACKSVRSL